MDARGVFLERFWNLTSSPNSFEHIGASPDGFAPIAFAFICFAAIRDEFHRTCLQVAFRVGMMLQIAPDPVKSVAIHLPRNGYSACPTVPRRPPYHKKQ